MPLFSHLPTNQQFSFRGKIPAFLRFPIWSLRHIAAWCGFFTFLGPAELEGGNQECPVDPNIQEMASLNESGSVNASAHTITSLAGPAPLYSTPPYKTLAYGAHRIQLCGVHDEFCCTFYVSYVWLAFLAALSTSLVSAKEEYIPVSPLIFPHAIESGLTPSGASRVSNPQSPMLTTLK